MGDSILLSELNEMLRLNGKLGELALAIFTIFHVFFFLYERVKIVCSKYTLFFS